MTHSNQSTSPLRQRMIDDMTLRKLTPKTQATAHSLPGAHRPRPAVAQTWKSTDQHLSDGINATSHLPVDGPYQGP
jgi:hypothetical protein